jgi:zinc transport system substrate-binding protein
MHSCQRIFYLLLTLSLLALTGLACSPPSEVKQKSARIPVVTTLFPLYDFAKNVGGDRADVTLLLPPGMEPHSFEPRPSDILTLNRAGLFIYTSPAMEPWADSILKGLQNKGLVVVDSSRGISIPALTDEKGHGQKPQRHPHAADPHIWLDFSLAVRMVENIRDGFITKDPASKDIYDKNAAAYIAELRRLDDRYRAGLRRCQKDMIVSGGHFAFAYMAHRYGFRYISVYGASPNAEPSAADLARVMKLVRDNGLSHLFHEELINPRVAETLSRETGVTLLKLNAAGNVTRDDFDRGETFLSLMEKNLVNLEKGLQCR